MRQFRYLLLVICCLGFHNTSHAQTDMFGMGCVYDFESDGTALQRAKLLTRDYTSVPRMYSLKQREFDVRKILQKLWE